MTKIQWIFLLCLLASCGADNNQQNSEPAQGLRQIPKNPYAIEWADTVDIFVWRARLLDTLGNVWGEQLLIKDIDTLSLMPHATLWLCRGRDSVQLPRIQLFDQRAVRQPRVAVIELWEDSLHSLRKQIKIPAGYDGVAFDIKRPEPRRIVRTITVQDSSSSFASKFVRIDILERDSIGVPTKGRAVYYIEPHCGQFPDSATIYTTLYQNIRCTTREIWSGMEIPLLRPYRTMAAELHIESSELRYQAESEITKRLFDGGYQLSILRWIIIDWELLGQLVALCDAKQYAPAKLEHNQAVVKTILDSLAVFQTNLIQFEQTKQLLPHISWGRSYIEVWRQLVEHTIIVLQSSTQQAIDLQPKTNQIFANARQKLITIEAEARQLLLEDYRKIYQLSGNLFPASIVEDWLKQEIEKLYACTPQDFAKCIKAAL